ncbi:potassium/proton antiporter [Roseateles puraquae]|uniref:K+/H+ antiporter n=1 Tax=Roseateles puraquae TaxID=431059 RepID=A0A254N513_9BURK|nr:potassium/proton antiporter [Roseateles puraquae]MDG0856882.1 potassium/proton antiporter [Roseateles puraquae]OWR03149.1 K+/H+ antiporter [Roseateles puraquae]
MLHDIAAGPELLTAAVAALVLVAIAGALYTHRFGLSHLLVFMAVGMLTGVDGPLGLPFDNHRLAVNVGNLALALILFDGGLRTRWVDVRRGMWPAGLLATVGVAVTALIVAGLARAVLGVSWVEGLLLGAAVSSTDAAAVFAQFSASQLRLAPRLAATIEVESAMNDPMAMVLTLGLIAWLTPLGQAGDLRVAGAGDLLPLLAEQLGLGLLMGLGGGMLAAWWVRRLPIADDHDGLAALLMAALGLLLFAVTNRSGGSGFLAVYLAGLLVRHRGERVAVMSLPGLNGYTWLAQAVLFLLLGLLVTPHEVWRLIGPALAMAAGLMFVARPAAVVLCLAPLGFSWRAQCFVAWSGLRGAVPIVLATYPVLAGLPDGWRFFDVAFVVVLLSLLVQGPTLAPLARRLGLDVQAQPGSAAAD